MRYVRKPITVEAIVWNGYDGVFEIVKEWAGSMPLDRIANDALVMHTPAGTRTYYIGDYVVRGEEGDVFPMVPEMFKRLYEPVDEEEA